MQSARRRGTMLVGSRGLIAVLAMLVVALIAPARAQTVSLDDLLSAVVHIKTSINPDGRSVANLGRNRDGTGIVIDNDGLILTIGYLMVEAESAEVVTSDGRSVPANVVGYDHESGFGLLRAIMPLKVRSIALGHSADLKEKDPVVIVGHGGRGRVARAQVVSRRAFAGSWEYLLDDAIYTWPPYPEWSGAALIDRSGKLVGVGSLILKDASGRGEGPGNMFVPIDRLTAILADLIADGHAAGPPRPWLGVITQELGGRLVVSAVTPDGPAAKAGIKHGDIIESVGSAAGGAPKDMEDFYRKIYAQGAAGVTVPLDVRRADESRHFEVKSMNRLDHLRLKSTY
jgi:S1-C subfamily serine protease